MLVLLYKFVNFGADTRRDHQVGEATQTETGLLRSVNVHFESENDQFGLAFLGGSRIFVRGTPTSGVLLRTTVWLRVKSILPRKHAKSVGNWSPCRAIMVGEADQVSQFQA